MQRSRAIGLAALAAMLALALVMSCALGRSGLERGYVPPIELQISLGALRLLTVWTDDPTCSRPIHGSAGPECSSGSIYNPNRYYIGWLEVRSGPAGRERSQYRKLFIIRLPS